MPSSQAAAPAKGVRASRRLNGDAAGSPLAVLKDVTRPRTRRTTAETSPTLELNGSSQEQPAPVAALAQTTRRTTRSASREISPALSATTAQPTTSTRKTAVPKSASKNGTKGRGRKPAAVAVELPAIVESPLQSPPGTFPSEAPYPTTERDSYTHTPLKKKSTNTKRPRDSSTDRSVESHAHRKRPRHSEAHEDEASPSQQLLGFATGRISTTSYTPPTPNPPTPVPVAIAYTSPEVNTDDSDAHLHTSPTTHTPLPNGNASLNGSVVPTPNKVAPTPVGSGLFSRVIKNFFPMSARSARTQPSVAAPITSPSPAVHNLRQASSPTPVPVVTYHHSSPLYVNSPPVAPTPSEETSMTTVTPSSAPPQSTIRHNSLYAKLPISDSPEFYRSSVKKAPTPAPVSDGYESDEEIHNIIDSKPLSREEHLKTRANLRNMSRDILAQQRAIDVEAKKHLRSPRAGTDPAHEIMRARAAAKKALQLAATATPSSKSSITRESSSKKVSKPATTSSGTGSSMKDSSIQTTPRRMTSSAINSALNVSPFALIDSNRSETSSSLSGHFVNASSSARNQAGIFVPVDSVVIPATARGHQIIITDPQIADLLRSVVQYSQSHPHHSLPDPEEMPAVLDQYHQDQADPRMTSAINNLGSSQLEDVFMTSPYIPTPTTDHVYDSRDDIPTRRQATPHRKGALANVYDGDEDELSFGTDSSPFISTPAARKSSAQQQSPAPASGSRFSSWVSSAIGFISTPLKAVRAASPKATDSNGAGESTSDTLAAITADTPYAGPATRIEFTASSPSREAYSPTPARRREQGLRPPTGSSRRSAARKGASTSQRSTINKSGLSASKGSGSSADIHADARQKKRVTFTQEKEQDIESFESSPTVNRNGKRNLSQGYSVPELSDSDDEEIDWKGMTDAQLLDYVYGDDKLDALSINDAARIAPEVAEKLRKISEYMKREKQAEKAIKAMADDVEHASKSKAEEARKARKTVANTVNSYLYATNLSPISERSERSESSPETRKTVNNFGRPSHSTFAVPDFEEDSESDEELDDGPVAQSTPLPQGGVETLPTPSLQSPLKEKKWPQAAPPATPQHKSYAPIVPSSLRHVSVMSPLVVVESPFAAVKDAPSPPLVNLGDLSVFDEKSFIWEQADGHFIAV